MYTYSSTDIGGLGVYDCASLLQKTMIRILVHKNPQCLDPQSLRSGDSIQDHGLLAAWQVFGSSAREPTAVQAGMLCIQICGIMGAPRMSVHRYTTLHDDTKRTVLAVPVMVYIFGFPRCL